MGSGESFLKRLRERFYGKDVRVLICGKLLLVGGGASRLVCR